MSKLTKVTAFLISIAAISSLAAVDELPSEPIVYSNEEQVYFLNEAKEPSPPLVYIKVQPPSEKDRTSIDVSGIDAFGRSVPLAEAIKKDMSANLRPSDGAFPFLYTTSLERGPFIHLRRARPATCWVAIRRETASPGSSADWYFERNVKLHDQGGRASVGENIADVEPLVIRMRNVTWQNTPNAKVLTNRPSLVLYVHKPDQPDRAESYVWADPGAARIGINLRWMQASCTIDGAEKASEVNSSNFRG